MARCAVTGNPRTNLLGSLPSSAFSQSHEDTTSFWGGKNLVQGIKSNSSKGLLHPEEVSISVNWIFTYLSEWGLTEWGCSGAKADGKTGLPKSRGCHWGLAKIKGKWHHWADQAVASYTCVGANPYVVCPSVVSYRMRVVIFSERLDDSAK